MYTPYVKMIIIFDFCVYQKVLPELFCLYTNLNNNDSHHKNTAFPLLYIPKKEKLPNFYIYIQKSRNTVKIKTICVTFLFTKSQTLYVTRFSSNFWSWHLYIYKNMTLCAT